MNIDNLPLFFTFHTPKINDCVELTAEESRHCLKTLRLRKGDFIGLSDGKGAFFVCLIDGVVESRCIVTVKNLYETQAVSPKIRVASALTKNAARMEFFLEKAVEVGIASFTPLKCKHSERSHFNKKRFEKIAISALKQSRNLFLPEIDDITDFHVFLKNHKETDALKLLAHKETDAPLLKELSPNKPEIIVLIGPEGGFSDEEIQEAKKLGYLVISLGKNRLRTETAALFAVINLK